MCNSFWAFYSYNTVLVIVLTINNSIFKGSKLNLKMHGYAKCIFKKGIVILLEYHHHHHHDLIVTMEIKFLDDWNLLPSLPPDVPI